jgi:hypothetical protein
MRSPEYKLCATKKIQPATQRGFFGGNKKGKGSQQCKTFRPKIRMKTIRKAFQKEICFFRENKMERSYQTAYRLAKKSE